jgi:hypothetical protein
VIKTVAIFACAPVALVLWTQPVHAQRVPQGSYQQTCSNIQIQGDTLIATCRVRGGRQQSASLTGFRRCVGDIGNNNGALQCNLGDAAQGRETAPAATAPGRHVPQPGDARPDRAGQPPGYREGYGEPSYGQPRSRQQPSGQPSNDQPPYDTRPDRTGQPRAPRYGEPSYGQPGYRQQPSGQPSYDQPPYSQPSSR